MPYTKYDSNDLAPSHAFKTTFLVCNSAALPKPNSNAPKKMMRCFRQSIPGIFNSICLRVSLADCDMVQFSEIKMCLEMCLQKKVILGKCNFHKT